MDDLFGQDLEVVTVICILVTDDIDQAGPAATDAHHLITFTQGAYGDGANCGIQPRNVTSACENTNDTFFSVHICLRAALFIVLPILCILQLSSLKDKSAG